MSVTSADDMPAEAATERSAERWTAGVAADEPLHRPWRAAIAGAELLLAGAAVWVAILVWSSAITTIGAETTRYSGNRIGAAIALGAVAALLLLDALRQLVLALRARRRQRDVAEEAELAERESMPWAIPPDGYADTSGSRVGNAGAAGADSLATVDGAESDGAEPTVAPFDDGADADTERVDSWSESDTQRVAGGGPSVPESSDGAHAATASDGVPATAPSPADDRTPPAGMPAQEWPPRDEDT